MAKKAIITVIGRQNYGDSKDKIEMKTVGTIDTDDTNYIIEYNEALEDSSQSICVRLTIAKDESRVEMIKSGPFSSCLIIEKSKRHLCSYGTEYGNTYMGIFGKDVEAKYGNTEGKFEFSYEIDINGAVSSQNEVTIKYRVTG